MINLKLPVKLAVLAVSTLKFSLLQVGLTQSIQAVDLCTAVSSQGNASVEGHCELVNLIEKFEKMSILDAKEALKNAALDQETLKNAFVLAQQNKNAVAMAVLANQFKVLKGGDDVLSHLVPLQLKDKNKPKFDTAKFRNNLARMLREMIAESQKSTFNGWSAESIRFTENAVTDEAQRIVEENMNHFLAAFEQKETLSNSVSKDILGDDYVRLIAQISKSSND